MTRATLTIGKNSFRDLVDTIMKLRLKIGRSVSWLVAVAFLLLVAEGVWAQETSSGFVERVYQDDAGEHKYAVFVPENYTPTKKWPVILFLHGAGERGTDGQQQLTVGLAPMIKARRETFPFIAVFPQCEDTEGRILQCWLADSPDGKRALEILNAVEKDYSINPDRRILTGWSMGGYGAWSLAAAMPEHWAAVVPLAGGGDPAWASKLTKVPIWAFHGAEDAVVLPSESRTMIQAIRDAGGRPRFDALVGVDHNVWKIAYDSDQLYQWLLNPSVEAASQVKLRVNPGNRATVKADDQAPFYPAVEVADAVSVRLGNDVLDALSYTIPQSVPRDMLTGRINDIYDSTNVEGMDFSVAFSGISYSGELARAKIQAYDTDRLNIQLGLQNVYLTIGGTYVTGRSHSAVAGPISVAIGYQRPVWLSFDVTPYIQDRKLRLRLVATRFSIPNDNWYVTSPAGVSTRGLGMTSERVSNGLVSGLYGSKWRIEQEVAGLVPSLVQELEQKLEVIDSSQIVNSLWPLPVYKPRVRVWPQAVSTDKSGISLVMGMTAAAIDQASAPKQPRLVRVKSRSVGQIPKSRNLEIGVTPQILNPLTELLIRADVARIHVRDIPEKQFAVLADPKALAEAIPDLKRYGDDVEVWSELILAEPITIEDAPPIKSTLAKPPSVDAVDDAGADGSQSAAAKSENGAVDDEAGAVKSSEPSRQFEFVLPKVLISLAIRTPESKGKWQHYAEFEIKVTQRAWSRVLKPTHVRRQLKLDWSQSPEIAVAGRFSPEYAPDDTRIDAKKIGDLFTSGWHAWTHAGPSSTTTVPDLEMGFTRLRIKSSDWDPPQLTVDFETPEVKLTNSSPKALVYETKGPYSRWGGPYTLEPGDSHAFKIPYPLVYRSQTDRGQEVFTLKVGSHSEFRIPKAGGEPRLFRARESIPSTIENPEETLTINDESVGEELQPVGAGNGATLGME